ncbi:hypothetical protein [Halobacterium litoreum]|uniref:Ig-like domain-containing protein n=1 Tax=Halobacterium litoreum TaxID=2039234 RepID=A0ABD5NID6_9EURY|nr:hypothetical protein [Halobacterium litoreum]UHH12152.1 hypothetical protein LT972_08285 [Halobacterium litoreum]
MERRAFLGTAGIALSTLAAGCASRAPSADDSTTRGPTSDETTRTETTDGDANEASPETERTRVAAGETVSFAVGDGSLADAGSRREHLLVVPNRGDGELVASLAVERDGEASFDRAFALAPGAAVRVSLTDLARFDATCELPERNASESVALGPDAFTCNVQRTSFALRNGDLTAQTASTLMACPGVVTEHVPAGDATTATVGGPTATTEPEPDEPAPHALVAENPTDETWTVRLLVERDGQYPFDGVYALEPGASASVSIPEPADYALSATVVESGDAATETVAASSFDCNQRTTAATVGEDGTVDAATVSTLLACPE